MNGKKRIICNFASKGREVYLKGSQRLLDSMNLAGIDADLLVCSPDSLPESQDVEDNGRTIYLRNRMPTTKEFGECPPHTTHPYAFKSYIIQEARDMGYEKVMWADSSCVFLKDAEPYWHLASEIGVVTLDNPGCPEATWTADDCLEHMGCDPEFAKTFFEIDAYMIIFDFSVPSADPLLWERFGYTPSQGPIAHQLFTKYFEHSRDGICCIGARGSTRPDFRAHRHDQSIISYFIKIYNIHPLNYGVWCYAGEVGTKFNPTFVKAGVSQNFNWPLVIDMHKQGENIMGTSFI